MANKFYNYLGFMAGTSLLFYFFGLIDGGATDTFINLLLSPENLSSSQKIGGLLGIAAGVLGVAFGSAVLGFRADIVIFAPIVATLFGFGWDFLTVFLKLKDASPIFAILVLAPLILLWVVTVLEWWRGVTN